MPARRSSSGPRKPGTRSAGAKRDKTTKKRSQAAKPARAAAGKKGAGTEAGRKAAGSRANPRKGAQSSCKRSQAAKSKRSVTTGKRESSRPARASGSSGTGAAQRKAGRAVVAGRATLLGRVVDAYARAGAATVTLEGELRAGDLLHFRGHTTDFCQRTDELRLADEPVQAAGAGQVVGIAVRERVRAGDRVYRVDSGNEE